jgi:hypothetical protein
MEKILHQHNTCYKYVPTAHIIMEDYKKDKVRYRFYGGDYSIQRDYLRPIKHTVTLLKVGDQRVGAYSRIGYQERVQFKSC